MPDIPKLNYAARPPIHKRKNFRMWVYTAVAISIVASSRWWLPPMWQRAKLLYWQHQCMVYTPPNRVVLDKSTQLVPKPWPRFYSLYSPPGGFYYATLFLHEMHTPSGKLRLVVVDVVNVSLQNGLKLFARTFEPGTLTRQPADRGAGSCGFECSTSARFYAGQIDPADPSHFTFREVDGAQELIFDGWLQNDDNVVIGERRSRTTQTAPDVYPGLRKP